MKKNPTKRALLASVFSLVLCLVMLLGTTFAWFTDTASTAVNKIVSGKLKVDIVDATTNESIQNDGLQFVSADGVTKGENILWEPGATYKTTGFRIKSTGTLALKYKLALAGVTGLTANGEKSLLDVIHFSVVDENGNTVDLSAFEGHLTPAASLSGALYIQGTMDQTAGNDYQEMELNGIGITVIATQDTVESDSKDNQYDATALYPDVTIIDKGEGKAEEALGKDDKIINVALQEDVTVALEPYDNKPLGGESTELIIIDGQGHKLTFHNNNSDWTNVTWGDAKLIIKNAVIDNSGYNADGGPWNSHDITFKGNVELENVVFTNAVALEGTAALKNVDISDPNATQDTYMLWICAGSHVTMDGCTINGRSQTGHANRAIAIKDQYVKNPGLTTLVVKNSTISSDKYAAVLVTSAGGANITMDAVDISGTKDTTNAVWYENSGENITVSGCTKIAKQ